MRCHQTERVLCKRGIRNAAEKLRNYAFDVPIPVLESLPLSGKGSY